MHGCLLYQTSQTGFSALHPAICCDLVIVVISENVMHTKGIYIEYCNNNHKNSLIILRLHDPGVQTTVF